MRLPISAAAIARLKRVATVAIAVAVVTIIVRKALELDWPAVLDALSNQGVANLATAFALAVPAYAACSAYDLIGRRAVGHKIPAWRTMLISFTGYFFSLNLGALIGGLAMRARLYSPYKLKPMAIGQIIALSILTNWSGFVLLAGSVLVIQPPELPNEWGVGAGVLRGIGFVMLSVTVAYVAACLLKGGTRLKHKRGELQVPTIGTVGVQFALSSISWLSIGAIITSLLPGDVSWFLVMPTLMVSAIAGMWSHIPGGLGVTEAIFIVLLGHIVPEAELLAAILLFRLVYYIVPFAIGLIIFAYLEATGRRAVDVPAHLENAQASTTGGR